ncbi:MAG TPA: AAA family ATPase, partial [Anaerolineales bacterium]|nr:AAA family ATPase [Anaerolineales bacterium]
MPGLRICLFQSLRVYVGADLLTDFRHPRQQVLALLAYLLLHRSQPIPRARLAFLLWPDVSETEAVTNLRRVLHALKRALPAPSDPSRDYVQADRQSVAWNLDSDYWLDVQEFETLLTQGTPPALEQAVTLYTGDLLEEFYDDWVLSEREQLRIRYIDALNRLIVHQRTQRQFTQAIATARQLLARDPLHEKSHQQLMALLYLTGDRSSALRQYDKCCEALRQELEVEPLEETRALQGRILRGEPLDEPFDARSASGPTTTLSLRPHPGPAGIMPPLVGRETENAWLGQRWNAAEAGQGSVTLVQGEAGVGKTRLVFELVEQTQGRAFVLAGGAHASERLLPYHPVVEALRAQESALAKELEAAVTNPDSRWWLAEVALLLPELRERWPQLPTASTQDIGQARLRLLEGLTRCLLALAARQPVLVILDDLHWADEATLAWLEYVTRQVQSARVLIVGTYRSEEESPALEQTRLVLAHEGMAQELRLSRLSSEAVAQLIQNMTGSAGRAINFSRRLYRETEGNPLFLVETLRALFEAGFLRLDAEGWQADWEQAAAESAGLPLPATIREAIRARLRRLSETARQVLEAASVVGRQFDDRVAWQASGRTEGEAVAALEEATRAQLVAEHEGGYRFTHDKIQEVAYSDLSAGRKRLLHRRVAESLESWQRNRSEAIGQLAYHYDRAEAWDRVVPHARAGADRAKQIYASTEALAHYDLALKALARL